jgi:hypothetical protein
MTFCAESFLLYEAVILSNRSEAQGVEEPAFALPPLSARKHGCPTLAAFLFLRLGWASTNSYFFTLL